MGVSTENSAVLIDVPQAELRQVQGNTQAVLAQGSFSISSVDIQEETKIQAQVGDVPWEILPASQTLKAGELTYIFSTPTKDLFYALTLGATTEPEAVGVVEAVLEDVSLLRESDRLLGDPAAQEGEAVLAQGVTYRSGLARGIYRASSTIATGLRTGASYTSSAFERAGGLLMKGDPTEKPVQLSDGFKRRIDQTASVAKWVARAANSVVGGLAWLGGKVAGGVLWAVGADKPLKPGEEAGVMREVSHAALGGFTEVWDSMEEAGALVLTSARDSTARVVEHRYGPEAGQASTKSMNAAGYATDAFWSARRIGVRTVAKAAAKRTAKGVMHQWAGRVVGEAGEDNGRGSGGSKEDLPAGISPPGKGPENRSSSQIDGSPKEQFISHEAQK